jgi:hypothetical protein
MILGLVMYLLVEDTGNIHAQCLDIMTVSVSVSVSVSMITITIVCS